MTARLAVIVAFLALPCAALETTPAAALRAADEAISGGHAIAFTASVRAVGAVAATQPSLDVRVRALRAGNAWDFRIEGEAAAPGDAPRPLAISSESGAVRAIDSEQRAVIEANPADGMELLAQRGVLPAVFWLVMWEGLVREQIDAGTRGLPMSSAGTRIVGGRECNSVRIDYTRRRNDFGGLYDVWWFLDAQTGLPVRIEACYFRRDQNAYGFIIIDLTDVRITPAPPDEPGGQGWIALPTPGGYHVESFEPPGPDIPALAIGTVAPGFTLPDSDGVMHSLDDMRGSVVVLDFWATWCGPCIAAMPALQSLHTEFSPQGVRVIGMNVWESANAAAFMHDRGFTYALLLRADDVAEKYRVEGIPTIYVIGHDGRIVYRAVGAGPDLKAQLRSAILRALQRAEAAQTPPPA